MMTYRDQDAARLRLEAAAFARKIAPLYRALRWRWVRGDESRSIPTTEQLHERLLMLIDSARESGYAYSGGLTVLYDDDGASMRFTVDEVIDSSGTGVGGHDEWADGYVSRRDSVDRAFKLVTFPNDDVGGMNAVWVALIWAAVVGLVCLLGSIVAASRYAS